MRTDLKFRHVQESDILYLAENMREADAAEVMASNNYTPEQALRRSISVTNEPIVVVDQDDSPLVMMGVRERGLVSSIGVPWLLGCDDALKHKRAFITQVPKVLEFWFEQYRMLENYVHVKNTISIAWLKRIGFTMDEPMIFPNSGEYFMRFWMERKDV